MPTKPWRELQEQYFTPEEIAQAEADALRGCLIAYDRDGAEGWVGSSFHQGIELRVTGATLRETRDRMHTLVRERLGDVLEFCAETLPLDAGELEEG